MKQHKSHPLLWWSALAAVAVVLGKVLLAGVVIAIGEKKLNCGSIDGSLVAATLGPTLGALVAAGHSALRDPVDAKNDAK